MAQTPRHTDDQFPPTSPNADEAERRFRATPPDPNLVTNPHSVSKINRQLVVERMMLDGVSEAVIVEVVSRQFDKAEFTIREDLKGIRKRWAEEDSEQRQSYKASAMRRIQGHIKAAKTDKAWGAVSSLERLLAQIQGTLEPVQVNVEFVARQALADYICNLSDDELDELALEQKEMERKAAMFERGFDPASILDVEGCTIQ